MFIRLITLVALFIFATHANADDCNSIKNPDFGINQEKIKSKFKLDTFDVSTTGEATIVSGAMEICEDIPENSVVEFGLIDNKLVQMSIINKSAGNSLLTYADQVFGERDNLEKDPKKIKLGQKVKTGLWTKDGKYNIVYTTYEAGGHNFEKLIITATGYKALFNSVNEVKSKAADDYLKENKLGAYSPDYKETPDTIEKPKNNDDKKPDKNKVLKENDNDRGYHYE